MLKYDFFDNEGFREESFFCLGFMPILADESLSGKGIKNKNAIKGFNARRKAGTGEQSEAKGRKPKRTTNIEPGKLRKALGRKKLPAAKGGSDTPF